MDKQGFQTMLEGRKVPAEKMNSALALAERFEQFAAQAWRILHRNGLGLLENSHRRRAKQRGKLHHPGALRAVHQKQRRLCRLPRSAGWRRSAGKSVQTGGEKYGEALRDEVFAGIGVAPYGLPTPEKPRYMQPVIERLEKALGAEACRALIADSLRDLPDYAWEREIYQSCASVDEYLVKKKQKFMEQMETCQREGRLFFAQEVTDEVLEFIRSEPEMGGGVRVGNIVYETKIPFLTKEYLAESDPTLKRYYYCHCPWAREAVKSGEKVAPIFCNCSAGFHKKPWEGALGQKIQVDVLESVLKGDDRCRFAIHLPETVIPT